MSSGLVAALGCVWVLLVSFEQGFDLIEDGPLLQRRETLEHSLDPCRQAVAVDSSIFGGGLTRGSVDWVDEFFERDAENLGEHRKLWCRRRSCAVLVIGDDTLRNPSGLGQLRLSPAPLEPVCLDA